MFPKRISLDPLFSGNLVLQDWESGVHEERFIDGGGFDGGCHYVHAGKDIADADLGSC